MKQILNRTILRKFLILGVMIVGLAFVSTADLRSAVAAPCCEECESQLNDCLSDAAETKPAKQPASSKTTAVSALRFCG